MSKHRAVLWSLLALWGALGGWSVAAGCSHSPEVRWQPEQEPITPAHDPGNGYLVVEKVDPMAWSRDSRKMLSASFVLYDARGRFVARYDHPWTPPARVRPGKYIVFTIVEGEERQIQAIVQESRLTRINLSTLEARRAKEQPPAEVVGKDVDPHFP
jgi:hypothetical protein